jgi:hypothetical protein
MDDLKIDEFLGFFLGALLGDEDLATECATPLEAMERALHFTAENHPDIFDLSIKDFCLSLQIYGESEPFYVPDWRGYFNAKDKEGS